MSAAVAHCPGSASWTVPGLCFGSAEDFRDRVQTGRYGRNGLTGGDRTMFGAVPAKAYMVAQEEGE